MKKWIRLDGLKMNVSIGIHDFEKKQPQPYRLDIGLELANSYRTLHDAIAETINYDALRSRVLAHLGSRHFNLQETVIQDVMDICFDIDARVTAVDVRTAKTAVDPDCAAVGLHFQATRDEWLHPAA